MAEAQNPAPEGETKPEAYQRIAREIASIVAGETSETARFATASSVLSQAFTPRFFWTGFYLVDPKKPEELVVGPYQGTLGCLRIPFGRGVCGVAAQTGQTQRVEDVHSFEGHIACDARTNSEIVVPVYRQDGSLAGVLDVDSEQLSAFDEIDREGLEQICEILLTTP